MEKIDNLKDIKLLNSNCLIEIEGLVTEEGIFETETKGGIITDGSIYKYNKGTQAKRHATLVRLPHTIEKKPEWMTDAYPKENSEIWFNFQALEDATKVECQDKIYVIIKYNDLIMARNDSQGVMLLNGYLLAQKAQKPPNKLSITEEYYEDIYVIKYEGKPNLSYKDGRYLDDPSITVGMTVMTRMSTYPRLENKMYWKFSEEEYVYFQRQQVISEVEL